MNMFKPTGATTPDEYIAQLPEPRKTHIQQIDAFIRERLPLCKPYIQHGMIGYGKVPYETKSGITGEWFLVGLASQKNYISIYASCDDQEHRYLAEKYKERLKGASVGKSCIRYRNFEKIDWDVLDELLQDIHQQSKSAPFIE